MLNKYFISYFLLFLIVCYSANRASAAADQTQVPGSSGKDVVDACIQKIEALDVFTNDFGFVKRIAYVSSNFGSSVADANAGIWQISSFVHDQLAFPDNQAMFSPFILASRAWFGTDVTNTSNPDYSIPLRGAFSVRLYIQLINGAFELPCSVAQQAQWFAQYFNQSAGAAAHFQSLVDARETAADYSNTRLDLWILLDGSASVGLANFQNALDLASTVTSKYTLTPDHVRVGFAVYSRNYTVVKGFDDPRDQSAYDTLVKSATFEQGSTQTGSAVSEVVTLGFNTSFGARPLAAGVPRVLVVITDGLSKDDAVLACDQAKSAGIAVFTVATGNGIYDADLNGMASRPLTTHVSFQQQEEQPLVDLEHSIRHLVANEPAKPLNDVSTPVTLGAGGSYSATFQLPLNGSITFNFHVISGDGTVYVSSAVPNPNSAYHDVSAGLATTHQLIISGSDVTESAPATPLRRKRYSDSDNTMPVYMSVQSNDATTLELEIEAQSPV